jgi:VanZ family protein
VRRFLFLIAALLAYGSLFPWKFEFASTSGNPLLILLHGWPTEWTRYVLRDTILNVVIYLPLGLATAFTFRRKHSRRVAAILAVAFGFLFSVSMELLQVYVPGRDPSLSDVLTNTIGTAAGAAFAICFESRLRQLAERRSGNLRPAAVLLLLIWAVSQLYPFFPAISITHLELGWAQLLQTPDFSFIETWANCAEWFAVGLALDTVFAHMRTSWLAVAMLCVPGQLFINDRSLTAPEVAGSLAALALWRFVRPKARPRWCTWMLGSAIILRQLQPFYFLAVPQPFSWIPFAATLEAGREAAAAVIARKAFDYGAMVWALRCTGVPYLAAGFAVTVALGIAEFIQTYLPGRSPEITDPLLALLMMLVLSALSRPASKAA